MRFFSAAATEHAARVDWITLTLLALCGVAVVAVFALIVFFCVRYRAGSKVDRSHPPTKANFVEFSLSGVLFVFGFATFIWAASAFYDIYFPPKDARTVYVVAKQWMWTFHDPGTAEGPFDEINVLHMPAGEAVKLVMTSEDVIHSFYVPAFRVKQDLLPGRYTSLWFRPERVGTYEILCAQYCGLSHSQMRGQVVVMEPAAYHTWQSQNHGVPKPPETSGGKSFTTLGCVACHGGASPSAPKLAGLYGSSVKLTNGQIVTADENYLRRSIMFPSREIVAGYGDAMPSYAVQLKDAQVLELIEYIKTLKSETR